MIKGNKIITNIIVWPQEDVVTQKGIEYCCTEILTCFVNLISNSDVNELEHSEMSMPFYEL